MKTKAIVACIVAAFTTVTHAQSHWCDSLSVSVSASASVSSNDELNPLWLYSNQWGIYTQYKQAELLAHAKAELRIANFKYFTLSAGLGGVGTTQWSRSMLHEAYLAGKLFVFDYTIGAQAHSPLAQYDDYTSGNFLMSSNARPYPRIGVGIFDYLSVPYTRNWLQIKGGVYVGRLFNEYDASNEYRCNYTRDVTISEKFAFVRLGGWIAKPYLGIAHSVMMGGIMPDGTKIPTDFWASFCGKGSTSDDFSGQFVGEQTNAAGAHQGLWDSGMDIELTNYDIHLSYKRPFSDAVGRKFFTRRSRDFYFGAVVALKNKSALKHLSFEWMRTDYQCGNGMPDPVGYDKNGNFIVIYPPYDKHDKEWFYEHFTAEEIEEWLNSSGLTLWGKSNSSSLFYSQWCNHGLPFGGRVLYATNGYYQQGWTVNGMCMQSALFHSQETVEKYGSGYNWQRLYAYPNTRIIALTLAADGIVANKVEYLAKLTLSNNTGTRGERYVGGQYSWELLDNYYFDRAKFEMYMMLKTQYVASEKLKFGSTIAVDLGELYKSVGLRFSVTRTF